MVEWEEVIDPLVRRTTLMSRGCEGLMF